MVQPRQRSTLDKMVGSREQGQDVRLTGAESEIPVRGDIVSRFVQVNALATAAYAAGDVVGELVELAGFARAPGRGGIIETVMLYETTTQAIAGTAWFFRKIVAPGADNASFAPSDADMLECVGFVPITSYSANAPGSNQVGVARGVGLAYTCDQGDSSLYVVLQTNGAPTYGAGGVRLRVTTILE